MDTYRRTRRRVALAGAVAAITVLGSLPATASGDAVGDLVNGLNLEKVLGGSPAPTGGGSNDSGGGSTADAGGGNPHATGTVAAVDLNPGSSEGDFLHGEEVVVGRSHAEQKEGKYQGKVTILALLGQELFGISTKEGETALSPFQPIQNVLNGICTGSDSAICLGLLIANSASGPNGSANNFGLATADLKLGDHSISAGVAESAASLEEDGSCQTATASSSLARADAFGVLSLRLLQSFAQSIACAGSPGSQSNDSTLLSLNGNGLPLPGGCVNGNVNGGFGILSLVNVSCNADTSSGSEGSRGTIGVTALDPPIANVTAPDASSGATAPAGPSANPPSTPGTDGGAGGTQGGLGDDGGGPGGDDGGQTTDTAAGSAQPGDGSLAFTGSNVALLALIGLGLIAIGGAFAMRRRVPRIGVPL